MSDQLPNGDVPERPSSPEVPSPYVPETPSHEPPTELPTAPPAPEQPIPVEPAPAQPSPQIPGPPTPPESVYSPPGPGSYGMPPMSPPPSEFASNYPRAGLNILGYVRPPGVYWDSLSTGFSMITSNAGVYALSTLILVGITIAIYIVFVPVLIGSMFAGGMSGIMSGKSATLGASYYLIMIGPQILMQFVLMFPVFGLISVGVRHAQGNFPAIGDFFIPFKKFKSTAMAALVAAGPLAIISVVSGLGQAALASNPLGSMFAGLIALALLLPIYLGVLPQLLLSGTAAIFGDRPSVESAKLVYTRMGWNSLMFGLLVIVAGIAGWLGFFACFVGGLFTLPIVTNVLALHYVYNFPEDQTPAQTVTSQMG